MATTIAELTKEEIAQRGKEIYYRDIEPLVEAGNKGRVVAIDVRTGEFELADDAIASATQLRARVPEAVVFLVRIGNPQRFGSIKRQPRIDDQRSGQFEFRSRNSANGPWAIRRGTRN